MEKRALGFIATIILSATLNGNALPQQSADEANKARGTAWVANGGDANYTGGSLSLIDLEKLKVVATLPVGGYPLDIVFTSGPERAYVSNLASDTVWVIDTRSLEIVTTITVVPNPGSLALTPDGEFLYVLSQGSGAISVIKTRTNGVTATISVPTQELLSLAITPNGRFVYATDCCTDTNVTVIDTKTNQVVTQIPLAGGPSGIAVTPNGRYVFVEDEADVSVIDTRTNTVVDKITAIQNACGPIVAISPDGALAYVEDYCSNTVYVVDTRDRSVTSTLSLSTPIGAAFSPDGKLLFITNNNCLEFPCTVPGTVSALRTEDNTLLDSVTVGLNAQNITTAPSVCRDTDPVARVLPDDSGGQSMLRPSLPCTKCRWLGR